MTLYEGQITVRELIDALEELDETLPVVVEGHCCYLEAIDAEIVPEAKWDLLPSEAYALIRAENLRA